MEEQNESLITFHIDTLDGISIPITTLNSISILALKQKILDITGIPIEKLRLIHKGRHLKDSEIINYFDITTKLQLVANLNEEEDIASMISHYNFLRTLRVYRRLSRFSRPELSTPYLYETLRQNSLTIDDLIRTNCFSLEGRVLQEGQWVDVKDTVEQWLEAQVVRIQQNARGNFVYIHYNGWPDRWDEWIDMKSKRIRPFRSKTLQTLDMASRSPFPRYPPEIRNNEENLMEKLNLKACLYMEFIEEMVKNAKVLARIGQDGCEEAKDRIEEITLQSVPVIDRIGRFMSDFSVAISRSEFNPNNFQL